ncbi:MAG: DUF924 family protein [Alphaproteobacteria bacterium]|nr:DUF924 family protein [Alphaproteobacteria bacterium]
MNVRTLAHVTDAINRFWYGTADEEGPGMDRGVLYVPDHEVRQAIRARFSRVISAAAAGQLCMMAESPEGAVALVTVLRVFPRVIYRDGRARANDDQAARVAMSAVERGFDLKLPLVMRTALFDALGAHEDREALPQPDAELSMLE